MDLVNQRHLPKLKREPHRHLLICCSVAVENGPTTGTDFVVRYVGNWEREARTKILLITVSAAIANFVVNQKHKWTSTLEYDMGVLIVGTSRPLCLF